MIWEPTRAAALARLASFAPRAGRDYATDRNLERGPTDRDNVSALSPWIRRRMITEEDLHPESWNLTAKVTNVAVLGSQSVSAPDSPAQLFSDAAIIDAADRAAAHFGAPVTRLKPAGVAGWAESITAKAVVTGHAPVGLVAREIVSIQSALSSAGIALIQHQRDWDRALWPHAKAGFFKLKTKLPEVVACL